MNEELNMLKKSAMDAGDSELIAHIDNLSQQLKNPNTSTSFTPRISCKYSPDDKGPYCVIVESVQESVGNLNPMNIGKLLHQTYYRANTEIKNICRKGRKRVGVSFTSYDQANWFVEKHTFPKDKYNIYIPARMVACMGIVRDIGSEIAEVDLILCGRGQIPEAPVVRVRRFKRTVRDKEGTYQQILTGTCLITFQGTTLPKYLELFSIRTEVQLYIPPVIQCYKCLRYGHVKNQCRGSYRCITCGGSHDSETDCTGTPKCVHCQAAHSSDDRSCREYTRQQKMREIMAVHNLSLYEANVATKPQSGPLPSEFPKTVSTFSFEPTRLNNNNVRSFAAVARGSSKPAPKNKERKRTQGYDRVAHERALNNYSPSFLKRPTSLEAQDNVNNKRIIKEVSNPLPQTSSKSISMAEKNYTIPNDEDSQDSISKNPTPEMAMEVQVGGSVSDWSRESSPFTPVGDEI